MSKKVFEENKTIAPHRGHASGATDVEKAASQLVSDIKYKVNKEQLSLKTRFSPAEVAQKYLQLLSRSPAPPQVKAIARKKLEPSRPGIQKEQFTVEDIVESSLASAFEKVFMSKGEDVKSVEPNEYLTQLEETGERKYKVRVTDKKTGNSYIRYATRSKISELRANPNISSVEMTEYGTPYGSEKSKGEQTAAAKSGKGLDPVGKEDNDPDNDGVPISRDKNDQYIMKRRAAIGSAIASRKGTQKEEFISEVDKKDSKNKKVDIMKGKNDCVTVFPDSKVAEGLISEMSVSKDQQRAAGLALSAKRGKTDPSKLKGAAREMYDSMTEKQLEDFARTRHEGLPEKVKEENECGSPEKQKDTRGDYAKVNLIKNKLRAMGAKNPIVMVASEEVISERGDEPGEGPRQKYGDMRGLDRSGAPTSFGGKWQSKERKEAGAAALSKLVKPAD
jgi:hypothetical protein